MRHIAFLSLTLALCGCGGGGTRCAAGANTAALQQVPEGMLVTIRGRYVPEGAKSDYYSKNMTQSLFDVTNIDGKPVSLRAELVDPPTLLEGVENKGGELTLVGYFYRAVSTGSMVQGFEPLGTQGHEFSYAMKFRVKRPSE